MAGVWRAFLEPLASLLFPAHCAGCRRAVEDGVHLCPSCSGECQIIASPRCETCSQPFDGVADHLVCPNCHGSDMIFTHAVAVYRSRGVLREMIHRLKYDRERWLAKPLAELMSAGFEDPRLAGKPFDALVPVPLHPMRERDRTFNQAALLAGHLTHHCGIPVRGLLRRGRATTTQTALDRRGRMKNLRHAFELAPGEDVADLSLLLIDDVLTTGSTLRSCAEVLFEAGAADVHALTIARG